MPHRFEKHTIAERKALVLECGKVGAKVLALLDAANKHYGTTEVTKVPCGVRNKPSILVTGHDLRDMEMLLEQTKGTGVDVYTHGEMLIAHAHPAFKQYENLIANYGTSWANQKDDFPKVQRSGSVYDKLSCAAARGVPRQNLYNRVGRV